MEMPILLYTQPDAHRCISSNTKSFNLLIRNRCKPRFVGQIHVTVYVWRAISVLKAGQQHGSVWNMSNQTPDNPIASLTLDSFRFQIDLSKKNSFIWRSIALIPTAPIPPWNLPAAGSAVASRFPSCSGEVFKATGSCLLPLAASLGLLDGLCCAPGTGSRS